MAVLPPALAAAMAAWDQMMRRLRTAAGSQSLSPRLRTLEQFRALLLPAFAAVLSHPLLDFLNTYGVRFLYPFSKRWFYGDTLFIVDPWVWIALALGIVFSRVLRRRGRPRSDAPAQAALAAVVAYVAIMMSTSFAGRGIVRGAALAAGLAPTGRVLVAPLPLAPHRRMVLVEEGEGYRFGELRWTPRPVVRFDREVRPVNDDDPAVAAAKQLRPFWRFLVWARFPYYDVRRNGDSAVVTAGDGRYPGPTGSWAAVTAVVPAKPSGRSPPMSYRD